jgi:S1-C subfamily serine protease
VIRVLPTGAGHAAGLRIEDVIVKFDGKPVESGQDVAKLVADERPGASVSIGIIRSGKPLTLQAHLAEPAPSVSASEPMRRVYTDSANIPDETGFGIQFDTPAEPALTAGHQPGARIKATLQSGGGERSGLRTGDRIVRIDGTTIADVPQAVSVLKGSNSIRRVVVVRDDGDDPGNERLVFLSKTP